MSINFDISLAGAFFIVPNSVVDRFIDANLTELRVILYILRNARKLKSEDLTAALGIDENTLTLALEAWITRGVLAVDDKKIVLIPPAEATQAPEAPSSTRRPSYSFVEIENSLSQNSALRSVLQAGQATLGRSFSQTEYEILYSLYDYYGISPEAIMLLFSHCAETGKKNARAIESIAISWHKNEIFTAEAAENYILKYRERKNGENIVRRIFGISERKLTPKEKGYISRWFNDFCFGDSIIEFAYNKCADTLGKFSFSYIDKILESYKLAGVTNVETAEALPAPQKSKRTKKTPDREASYDVNAFSDWAFNSVYGDLIDDKKIKGGDDN